MFDRVEEKRDAMQSLLLPPPAQQAFARAIDQYFKQEEQTQRMALIKAQIDDALETGNKEAFLELSDELNRLKQQ